MILCFLTSESLFLEFCAGSDYIFTYLYYIFCLFDFLWGIIFLCFVLKGKRREIDESDDDGVKTVCCFEFRLETMLHRRYCVFTRGLNGDFPPLEGRRTLTARQGRNLKKWRGPGPIFM